MKHTPIRKSLFTAIAATVTITAGVQTQAEGLMLEEVVVTAQKRTENLQDVAASIAAIGSDALDDNAITSFQDATKMVPGLVMKQGGTNDTSVSLRGVTYDRKSAGSAAVDVYWNGAGYRASSMFTSMFDVERLEVLRGPQGSLQGKTSPAGAIIMHTKAPSFEAIEGQLKTSITDDGDQLSELGINLPLSDTLAVRLATVYNDNNVKGNKSFYTGEEDSNLVKGGRISVAYEPFDDFDAIAVFEQVHNNSKNNTQMAGSYSGTGNDYGGILLTDKVGLKYRQHSADMETEISSLAMNFRGLDKHEITSITSYNSFNLSEQDDRDPTGLIRNDFTTSDVENDAWGFSQELRIASTEGNWWEYTAGIYYSRGGTHARNFVDQDPSPAYLGTEVDVDMTKEDFGYFTHNRIDLSEVSELQVGLRYNRSRRDTVASLAVPDFGINIDQNSDRNAVGDAFTGGVKYIRYLSEDIMAYTSLDVSYRPGASTLNPRVSNPNNVHVLSYNEEDTLAFELGFKSTLLEGRMQLNGAFYYQQMDEYQNYFKELSINDAGDSNPASEAITELVGNNDAISMGAELEAMGLISENWRASLLLSYNDLTFADGEIGYCNEGDALQNGGFVNTCDLSGQRVGENPNLNVSASSEYTLPLEQVDVFVRGLYTFSGASYAPNLAVDERKAGAHGVLDLFTGVRSKDREWEVSLWAKNLLDKVAETEMRATYSNGYREVRTIPERSIGANLRYNFSM